MLLVIAGPGAAQETLFRYRSEFRVNLHHFLYVLGRARNGTPDSKREAVVHATDDTEGMDALDKAELTAWDEAVTYYQSSLSTKDAVFDRDFTAITRTLAAGRLDVDASLRKVLESAAPIYRKVWWGRHERANQARIREMQALVARHGKPVAEFLTRVYGQAWPGSGVTVQLSAYANWAGAYSTDGGLLVVSSTDKAEAGEAGLEALFHEAMHQWDEGMDATLARTAARVGTTVPRTLSHALIFYTAGYAVAREIPGHRFSADELGVWNRGLFPRARVEAGWLPYLKGEIPMEEALERLLKP